MPESKRKFHLQLTTWLIGPERMTEGKLMKKKFSISIQRVQRGLKIPNGLMGKEESRLGSFSAIK